MFVTCEVDVSSQGHHKTDLGRICGGEVFISLVGEGEVGGKGEGGWSRVRRERETTTANPPGECQSNTKKKDSFFFFYLSIFSQVNS